VRQMFLGIAKTISAPGCHVKEHVNLACDALDSTS
jgi:hypothetical protein